MANASRGFTPINTAGMAAPPAGGTDDIQDWLRRADWPRLQAHFARHAPGDSPADAQAFAARAILLTHTGLGPQKWAQVIADWQRACALQPGQLLHAVNLAQALIDGGRAAEAVDLAAGLARRAPGSYPVLEKHCLALHACSRWDEAAAAATRARAAASAAGFDLPPPTAALYAELQARWWQPLAMSGAVLRLPRADDTRYIGQAFGDTNFMRRFHRQQHGGAAAVAAFIERSGRPPRETRRRDWIVQDRHGRPAGFAAIVDIDHGQRRGELLVGIPQAPQVAAPLALQASLAAIAFAFDRLGLDKLLSYVYGDNPLAQANTLHLGFRSEGLLRRHLLVGDHRLDLHLNGLLREDFDADERLARLRRRWTPAPHTGSVSPTPATSPR